MTGGPFDSTLSAGGLFALRNTAFHPLRSVQGTSVMTLGWQQRPARRTRRALAPVLMGGGSAYPQTLYFPRGWATAQQALNEGSWMELEEWTAAHNDARRQATTRLREQAAAAGAVAVADVRVRRRPFRHAAHSIEVTAIGTALGSNDFSLGENETIPLVATSGGDFWKLVTSGYRPLGLVGGSSVIYVTSGLRTRYARFRMSRRSFENQEYEDYTSGLHAGRIRALGRMTFESRELGAFEVIGIEFRVDIREERDDNLLMTVHVLGNALAPLEPGAPSAVRAALELPRMSTDPTSPPEIPGHGSDTRQPMHETGGRVFTSDLSVNEYVLIRQAGFEPLGLVLGVSIYHVGLQIRRWAKNMELPVLTQAMYHARELAMTRMEAEADQLGADGVVGVRLDVGHSWGGGLTEFVAIGTAVRSVTSNRLRPPNGRPFTSDLSGQDFWTLLSAGDRPVGLVLGNCVYHVAHQKTGKWLGRVGRNRELPNYTQSLYQARELAMDRLRAEARWLRAAGVVGVELHEKHHRWGSHMIEFLAIGTAIVRTETEHEAAPPVLVLSLNDPPHSSD